MCPSNDTVIIKGTEYRLERVSSAQDKRRDMWLTVYRCTVSETASVAGFVGVAEADFETWTQPTWRVMGPICWNPTIAGNRAINCLESAISTGLRNYEEMLTRWGGRDY